MRAWLLLALALAAAPAHAALTTAELAGAVARPPAGAHLPAELRLVDQRDTPVTLGQVAAGRPLVLLFADYTCAHICGPGLSLTAGALHDAGLVPGRDYAFAVIGLDPKDSAADARAMAATRLATLPAEARAARLLRGDPAAVTTALHRLGYGVVYDAEADQFAHDASVYVFAPDGHLAALLPELALRPEQVRAAIQGAPEPRGLLGQVAHLCYGLAAASGRYGGPVARALQLAALLTVAGGALALWRLGRRGHAA